jgi:hypothetical protein
MHATHNFYKWNSPYMYTQCRASWEFNSCRLARSGVYVETLNSTGIMHYALRLWIRTSAGKWAKAGGECFFIASRPCAMLPRHCDSHCYRVPCGLRALVSIPLWDTITLGAADLMSRPLLGPLIGRAASTDRNRSQCDARATGGVYVQHTTSHSIRSARDPQDDVSNQTAFPKERIMVFPSFFRKVTG